MTRAGGDFLFGVCFLTNIFTTITFRLQTDGLVYFESRILKLPRLVPIITGKVEGRQFRQFPTNPAVKRVEIVTAPAGVGKPVELSDSLSPGLVYTFSVPGD